MIDFTPFWLSFKLATITTAFLFLIALPYAWWLYQSRSPLKPLFEAVTALPIVLPPSVLGFYLLWAFSDFKLAFTFEGLVVASMIYSLPFMVQPLHSGFESLNRGMIEASYIAGKGGLTTLFRVALPNIKPSLLTALVVTFAHTVGEFGVVLMVGGSIPNQTRVASVAIYDMVEAMDYTNAHIYSALMLGFSFLVLLGVYLINRRFKLL